MLDDLDDLQREFLRRAGSARLVPDGKLHHYTTAEGFTGVVRSGYIRGTNAAFMTDKSEVGYGHALCREVVAAELKRRTNPAEQRLLTDIDRSLGEGGFPYDIYVASFSEADDDLGQWRGYGESRRARYCLAFDSRRFSERDFLRVPMRVLYEPEEQRRVIRETVDLGCQYLGSSAGDRQRQMQAYFALDMELRRLISVLKHPSFSSEREWRSVASFRDHNRLDLLGFDVGADGLLRPWMAMLVGSRESERLPIVEVRILAGHLQDAAIRSTRLFLDKHGYSDAPLRESGIPFVG